MKDQTFYIEKTTTWESSQNCIITFKLSEITKSMIEKGLITIDGAKSIKSISDLDEIDGFFIDDYTRSNDCEKEKLLFESMSDSVEQTIIHSEETVLRDMNWNSLYKGGLIGYLRQDSKYKKDMSVLDEQNLFIKLLNKNGR
jgi:hypothetical protein